MPKVILLRDLGALWPGYQVRAAVSDVPDAPHRLITLGDVDGNEISPANLVRMDLGNKAYKYLLNPGDIVLRSRGANYRATLIPYFAEAVAAAAPLYVFRPGTDVVLPEFIVWWLNRDEVQERLALEARGSYIPTVSRESFEAIEVPIPAIKIQQQICEALRLRQEEHKITTRLNLLREQEFEALLKRAATYTRKA